MDTNLTANAKLVYGVLCTLTDSDDWFNCNNEDIGWYFDFYDKTVTRALTNLVQEQYIERKGYGRNRSIKIRRI